MDLKNLSANSLGGKTNADSNS